MYGKRHNPRRNQCAHSNSNSARKIDDKDSLVPTRLPEGRPGKRQTGNNIESRRIWCNRCQPRSPKHKRMCVCVCGNTQTLKSSHRKRKKNRKAKVLRHAPEINYEKHFPSVFLAFFQSFGEDSTTAPSETSRGVPSGIALFIDISRCFGIRRRRVERSSQARGLTLKPHHHRRHRRWKGWG